MVKQHIDSLLKESHYINEKVLIDSFTKYYYILTDIPVLPVCRTIDIKLIIILHPPTPLLPRGGL